MTINYINTLVTLIAGNTFSHSVVTDWNSLPKDIIESENILDF